MPAASVQVVSFGGVSARITKRGNGMYVVRWREAKQGRSTTSTTRDGAIQLAKDKVRELAGKTGSRMVTVVEAEATDGLKAIIGNRSLSSAVEQLKDFVERAGGWEHVGRSFDGYLKAGHGKLVSITVKAAVARFLLWMAEKKISKSYMDGLRKELEGFTNVYADLLVNDIEVKFLRAWIGRKKEDGTDPGAKFYNNRRDTWVTFLNWCRGEQMLAKGDQHAGEQIDKVPEPDKVPEIWTLETAEKALKAVLKEEPQSLAYLICGCWMALRPFEKYRLTWDKWDWETGYLDVGAHVAKKTMSQRFVPIPEIARKYLEPLSKDPRWGVNFKRRAKRCVRKKDQTHLVALLKRKKIITSWPQDVLRHSCISYWIAQGHGLGQVAEWAGNSETVIRKRYRRPLRKQDGQAWFKIGL